MATTSKISKTKKKASRADRVIVHETKVKVDLIALREIVKELRDRCDEVNADLRETHDQRSRFSAWNNINHFLMENDNGEDSVIIDVTGGYAGLSRRIYYSPSVTSLAKPFRGCIQPLNPDNVFVFLDFSACEFMLNCLVCGEQEALEVYRNGGDIYMHYAPLFPEGLPRDIIKKVLIANMYNTTAYRVAIDCGITENQAQRLLWNIAARIPRMTRHKSEVIQQMYKDGYYSCYSDLSMTSRIKIGDFDAVKGPNPLNQLSAEIQSFAAVLMASIIEKLQPRLPGTLLTVFDSMLIECRPERVDALKSWLIQNIKPFRTDAITVGKTFLEAYNG